MKVMEKLKIKVNEALSAERQAVEHFFGRVKQQFPFCDAAANKKLLDSPNGIGLIYRVCALLTNGIQCMIGSQTHLRYGIAPPTVEDYFQGGVQPQIWNEE